MVCNPSAFINPKDFGVQAPKDKSQTEFMRFAGEVIPNYPILLNAYVDLSECWNYYHGSDSGKAR